MSDRSDQPQRTGAIRERTDALDAPFDFTVEGVPARSLSGCGACELWERPSNVAMLGAAAPAYQLPGQQESRSGPCLPSLAALVFRSAQSFHGQLYSVVRQTGG
jgi:hypothetical protein